jgi:acetyl-CoA carboxylase carboxyltransferase component
VSQKWPPKADHLAVDDEHALAITRNIVRNLNIVKKVPLKLAEPVAPLYVVKSAPNKKGLNPLFWPAWLQLVFD